MLTINFLILFISSSIVVQDLLELYDVSLIFFINIV